MTGGALVCAGIAVTSDTAKESGMHAQGTAHDPATLGTSDRESIGPFGFPLCLFDHIHVIPQSESTERRDVRERAGFDYRRQPRRLP